MKRIFILSYKRGTSAHKLAKKLDLPFITHKTPIAFTSDDILINFGVSHKKITRDLSPAKVYNKPENIWKSVNKILTFVHLTSNDVPHIPWTTDSFLAKEWLENGHTVYARTRTCGNAGKGIIIMEPWSNENFVDANLYTQYQPNNKEYRVHVGFDGTVFDVQQKKKRKGTKPDPRIRTHDNGWIFARKNIEEPEELRNIALNAIRALDLDFGVVDILWNRKENECYVVEVNTAVNMVGQTLDKYCEEIKKLWK